MELDVHEHMFAYAERLGRGLPGVEARGDATRVLAHVRPGGTGVEVHLLVALDRVQGTGDGGHDSSHGEDPSWGGERYVRYGKVYTAAGEIVTRL
jgi:hypothetical protein